MSFMYVDEAGNLIIVMTVGCEPSVFLTVPWLLDLYSDKLMLELMLLLCLPDQHSG